MCVFNFDADTDEKSGSTLVFRDISPVTHASDCSICFRPRPCDELATYIHIFQLMSTSQRGVEALRECVRSVCLSVHMCTSECMCRQTPSEGWVGVWAWGTWSQSVARVCWR